MSNVHQTAIIDASASIHDSVKIGPYSVIGPDVKIAEQCELKSHVVLKGPTNIGPRNKFFSFCVIGEDTPDLKYKGEKSRLEIGANNRTNSPNNAVQRFHHSKWNVGMYGEGDNDFSGARWRDCNQADDVFSAFL